MAAIVAFLIAEASASPLQPAALKLPVFATLSGLIQHGGWTNYLRRVYGELPPAGDFPLDLNRLWLLHMDKEPPLQEGWERSKIDAHHCPETEGQLFLSMTGLPCRHRESIFQRASSPRALVPSSWVPHVSPLMQASEDCSRHELDSWLWLHHPPPYEHRPSNTSIEVTHCADVRAQSYELDASWYYAAPGSGVFLPLGRTTHFQTHREAVEHFTGLKCTDAAGECVSLYSRLFEAARAQGFDSIQFLGHSDMRCGNTAVEVVQLGGVGAHACGAADQSKTALRGGWAGQRACGCVNSGMCANCEVGVKARRFRDAMLESPPAVT